MNALGKKTINHATVGSTSCKGALCDSSKIRVAKEASQNVFFLVLWRRTKRNCYGNQRLLLTPLSLITVGLNAYLINKLSIIEME